MNITKSLLFINKILWSKIDRDNIIRFYKNDVILSKPTIISFFFAFIFVAVNKFDLLKLLLTKGQEMRHKKTLKKLYTKSEFNGIYSYFILSIHSMIYDL